MVASKVVGGGEEWGGRTSPSSPSGQEQPNHQFSSDIVLFWIRSDVFLIILLQAAEIFPLIQWSIVQKGKCKICQSGSLQRKEAINQTQKDSKTKVKATKGGLQALCSDVLSEVKAYLQAWCHLSLMLRTNWINAYPLVRFHQFSAIFTPYKRTPLMLKSKQRRWGYETVAYKL